MIELRLDVADVEEAKGTTALDRYRLYEVEGSTTSDFEDAYGLLDAEFGPRGELERREVIESWLAKPVADRSYHLIVACDLQADGRIAAVRDCHVKVDRNTNIVVTYLAHVLVLPEHRRGGLASLMRAAPLALAKRAAAGLRSDDRDILLAAEMEPAVMEEEATLVRLVAYGKVGFAAIDPAAFPYCQPDFRDLSKMSESTVARPLALIAIVRWVGCENARRLPKQLAQAYLDCLYGVFATHCRPSDLEELEKHSEAVLAEQPGSHVPLVEMPKNTTDREAFGPLLKTRVLACASPKAR